MNPNPVWMDPVKPIPPMTQHHRDLMAMGLCPFCERHIRGWRTICPNSTTADCIGTLGQHGIDHRTGHAESCEYKRITIESPGVHVKAREPEPSPEKDDTAERVALVALGGLAGISVGNLFH